MTNPNPLEDNWVFASDPSRLCSFDYEEILAPTKALMHQAARFLYFTEGKGCLNIDGVDYALRPGTLVAITPWQISDVTEVREPLHFVKIVYDFAYINTVVKGVPGFSDEGAELLRLLSQEPVLSLQPEQAETVDRLLDQLRGELGVESRQEPPRDLPFSHLFVCGKLIELMIFYRRCLLSRSGEGELARGQGRENSIFQYIYAHSAEKLTLARVAEVFYLSESSLSKQISELTGLTFPRLLSSIRVEKASDYLIYTDLTLDEIADLVGFVDASHLSKHFSSRAGITPTSYRKIYSKVTARYSRTDKNIAFSVTDYLFKHYAEEDLSAGKVAERFGVSAAEMNRLLLVHAEKNFDTLLHYIRIHKACELLASTERYVLDVALEVGYGNVKTFNMNFFKFQQMTPTEFRRRVTLQKADGSETAGKRGGTRRKN